jgi:hypothetical protein
MLHGAPAVEIRDRGDTILILLLDAGEAPSPSGAEDVLASTTEDLPARQRRLACLQHPGEYVVLVKERIIAHSSDRQEALRAYRAAATRSTPVHPVLVDPAAKPKRRPVLRGRSLKRPRPA